MISTLLKPTLLVNSKKYKVMEQIGEGGFAFVYNVMSVNKEDKRESYALKKMICQTDEQIAEAKKEIRLMQLFAHENIVPLLDSSTMVNKKDQTEIMLLMPKYDGSVQSFIDCGKGYHHCAFSDGLEVVQILRCSVEGLLFIHTKGYRHADFKPANILINHHGSEVGITDFGSATTIPCTVNSRAQALEVEEYAAVHTTASYRSPELFDTPSHCVIGAESDVWSFGCAMYCILFSRSPFENEVEGLSTLSVQSGQYNIPENHPWPREYIDIIEGCIRVNPLERLTLNDVKIRLQCIPCPPLTTEQMHKATTPERQQADLGLQKIPDKSHYFAFSDSEAESSTPRNDSSTVDTDTIRSPAETSADETVVVTAKPATRVSIRAINFANFDAAGDKQDGQQQSHSVETTSDVKISTTLVNNKTVSRSGNDPFSNLSAFSSSKELHGSNKDFSEKDNGSTRLERTSSNANTADSNQSGSYVMQTEGYCDSTYSFPTASNSPNPAATDGGDNKGFADFSNSSHDEKSYGVGVEDDSDAEFGEFVSGRQSSGRQSLSNSQQQPCSSFIASFPATSDEIQLTESTAVVDNAEMPPDRSLSHLNSVDLHKLIIAEVLSDKVIKAGAVNMMRASGFPKKLVKKTVWMVLTPAGLLVKKDQASSAKVHLALSLHRPLHMIATDTMSIGINGLMVKGSAPIPLAEMNTMTGKETEDQEWVQIALQEWTLLDKPCMETTEAVARDNGKIDMQPKQPVINIYRSMFTFAECELSFDSKEMMNEWIDAIEEQQLHCCTISKESKASLDQNNC